MSRSEAAWDRSTITASYLFLGLPILIFQFGWLRLPLALIAGALLCAGVCLTLRGFRYRVGQAPMDARLCVLALVLVLGWVLLSGIGGFGYQNLDFAGKNATLRDLIDHAWPVTYDFTNNPSMEAMFGPTGALVYYVAYFLPSALVGKTLGWTAANYALCLWTVIGVFLSIVLISRYLQKGSLLIVLAFVLASGLDILGAMLVRRTALIQGAQVHGMLSMPVLLGELVSLILSAEHLEWWSHVWQYSSSTTQLFWVFNQSVPAWLGTLLLLNQEDRRGLLFTYVLVVYFAPLPAIGLLPYLVLRFIQLNAPVLATARTTLSRVRRLLAQNASLQNLVIVPVVAFVVVSFYGAQARSTAHGFVWQMHALTARSVLLYLAFCSLEFGVFVVFVFRRDGEKPILAMTFVLLAVIPLYSYGPNNDFAMRASIPALVVLFAAGSRNVLTWIKTPGPPRSRLLGILLAIVMVAGSITPLHEIGRSWKAIAAESGPAGYRAPEASWGDCTRDAYICREHVLGNESSTFFFRVLAR